MEIDDYIPVTSVSSGQGEEVGHDLYCFCIQVVNVCFVGTPGKPDGWVLVDAGMPKSADLIRSAAEARFGPNARPRAIILTHGHFDHIGAVRELARHWDVSVYAHELELPYLTGKADYPEPDPTVEGGLVAKMSSFFPHEGIDISDRLQKLPSDGCIPHMPEWSWLHTPGHAPGHISLFREKDRMLIAGDAFITVRQDALFKVITQMQEISGPPRYFTTDWHAAKESVRKLQALQPSAAVTGHGHPVSGTTLRDGLTALANDFDRVAVPDYGRYVESTHS
ncbi:MBL fold metallo-hydrolase [Brevibacillus fluminis]|uniref:MBL fold metallo-hydrolase n=1 Tax=Brevibacillus fluminis TaxID=511487 RepID=UPI003F8CC109